MTKKAYKDSEGKTVILSTRLDECLYSGHWVAGQENNRFNELYVHIRKDGTLVFYEVYVTFWQGELNTITVIADVRAWLLDHYGELAQSEISRFEELGVSLTED